MLFSHLRDDPPENFSRIAIWQVLKADRQVFLHIKNNVGVRRDPANLLPMDAAIIQALQSYEVGFNLMPLPKTSEPKKDPTYVPDRTPAGRPHQYYEPYGKGKGHGKGKGKKGKRAVNVLPKERQNRDNVATDSHGRRWCFNYNLGKCSSKTPHGGQSD